MEKEKKLFAWLVVILVVLLAGAFIYLAVLANRSSIKKGTQSTQQINTAERKNILYKKDSDLVLYNIETKDKKVVFSSPDLIDYDLSDDESLVAYSLKEAGFDGNSDVFLLNLKTGNTIRLTEQNDIASLNPRILPDDSGVLYARRTKNKDYPQYLDDSVWIINSDGNQDSSRQVLGLTPLDYTKYKVSGEVMYCYTENELKSPKVSIEKVSPDSKVFSYNTYDIGNCEGGGMRNASFIKIADGSNFLSPQLEKNNTFIYSYPYTDPSMKEPDRVTNWYINDIFWFDDGSFITNNSALPPIGGEAYYYYNKNQNKQWSIFDSFKQKEETNNRYTWLNVNDIIEEGNGKFMIIYATYSGTQKYYLKELSLGDQLKYSDIADANLLVQDDVTGQPINTALVSDPYFLNENKIIYIKGTQENNSADIYLYDIKSKTAEKIDSLSN